MTKLLVICINYHDESNTVRFVKELLEQQGSEFIKILIADTSERTVPHSSLTFLQDNDNRVLVLTVGKNIGYLGAAHWSLCQYLENNELPEWIIISNTDLIISGDDLFLKLFSFQTENEPAIIAPSITSTKTYMDQNPCIIVKPRRIKLVIHNILLKKYFIYSLFQYLYTIKQMINSKIYKLILARYHNKWTMTNIYAAHGSFIVLPKEYFLRGGTLDYKPFLFGEEYFIAEMARFISMTILYKPSLKLFHHEHRTTGNSLNKVKWKYLVEAYQYCLENYFTEK